MNRGRARSSARGASSALAAFFIVVAVLMSALGDRIPADLILVFLGLLAVVGVFCLFAIAAGLFRFSASEDGRRR